MAISRALPSRLRPLNAEQSFYRLRVSSSVPGQSPELACQMPVPSELPADPPKRTLVDGLLEVECLFLAPGLGPGFAQPVAAIFTCVTSSANTVFPELRTGSYALCRARMS